MQLNPDRAELVSAATDLLLAAIAVVGCVRVRRRDWQAVFALTALGSLLGAWIHGLERPAPDASWWWWPLDFALAGALVAFGTAAARDRSGEERARHVQSLIIALAALALLLSRVYPASFLPMLAFQGAVLVVAGVSWLALAQVPPHTGAGRLAAGCAVAMLAAGVGALGLRTEGSLPLDANSQYHLILAPALLLWISGARATVLATDARARRTTS